MQFNNTSSKNGLIQAFEFWTRQPDGNVSGNTTLLAQATARINAAFDRIMPLLLSYNDRIRWDDLNNTDQPSGKFNLVINQNDYKITEDANSLDILNITNVRIKESSTATVYTELERITLDDPNITTYLQPASTQTGVPSGFVEVGNVVYLNCLPSYSATNGIEIFLGREQSYFSTSDTTKEPGIPKPFHELLALYAALDWKRVNRTNEPSLLNEIRSEIAKYEANLKTFIALKHPTRRKLTPKLEQYI